MKLKESLVSRRQFMNGCLGGTGMFLVGTAAYPLISSFLPSAEEAGPTEIKLPPATANLEPNSARPFIFGQTPALLIRSEQGELIALRAVCTHFECTVHYDPALRQIVCPCHKGYFDVHGKNLKGPPPRPLVPYQVREEADGLVITREKKK